MSAVLPGPCIPPGVGGSPSKHLSPDLEIDFQVTGPTPEGKTAGGQTGEAGEAGDLCPKVSGHRTFDNRLVEANCCPAGIAEALNSFRSSVWGGAEDSGAGSCFIWKRVSECGCHRAGMRTPYFCFFFFFLKTNIKVS